MRKTNIFLYILVALTLCCVVLGIVGAIMTYNDVQKYTIIKTNAYGYSSTSVGHIYHDLEVSLIVSGTSLLALSLLFLLLARFVKIKNRQLFAIGAVFVYLICMILLILATTTYYSYDGIILYAQRIDIDPTCLALMIATAVILGVLAIATIVYVVITTISAKSIPFFNKPYSVTINNPIYHPAQRLQIAMKRHLLSTSFPMKKERDNCYLSSRFTTAEYSRKKSISRKNNG